MARLPAEGGDGNADNDDGGDAMTDPTGVAGPEETPEPADDTGGNGDDTSGGGADDPTGIAGPEDTPEPADDGGGGGGSGGGNGGGNGGGADDPTGIAGPEDTPEPADGGDGTVGGGGDDGGTDGGGADDPTGIAGPDETPAPAPDTEPADTDDQMPEEGGTQDQPSRASQTAQFGGAFRAVVADPGRERRREPVAGGRQAAEAVGADPGRGVVDPISEVEAVSAGLDEAFISRRATTGREFGADIEGFDEVASGPFDLPDAFGGRQQEELQSAISEGLEFTEPFAEGAEDVRQGVLEPFGLGAGTASGVATAAAAGVAAPEPVTTVGGALALGGLAVGGIAFDVARRRDLVEIPEDGELFGGDEVTPPADGDAMVAGETRLVIPERTQPAEIPVPDEGFRDQSEIAIPDQPVGTGGEIGVPEVAASQFAQGLRQRQREERRRERGIFERPGADEEELQEILEGPDEDVVLGEETPPSEDIARDTGREFFEERDIDPRVVVPEETVTEAVDRTEAAEESALTETAMVSPFTGQGPLIVPAVSQVGGQTTRTDTLPDVDTSLQTDQSQAMDQRTATVPETATPQELGQPPELADPTTPELAQPTPVTPAQGEVFGPAVSPTPTRPPAPLREFDIDLPEGVGVEPTRRRREEFEKRFTFPVADAGVVLGDETPAVSPDLEDLL